MVKLSDIFAGRSISAYVKRARQRLAMGDFDEANRLVVKGLEKFPGSQMLRETQLTIRRAQARMGMQELKARIVRDKDPVAYEQLIQLYREVVMRQEARRTAEAYAHAYPDRDTPHLLLGEMDLEAFFQDLQARDAHSAHDHLLRAARLNTEAIKPRLLLAELYFCVDARRSLAIVAHALKRVAPEDETVQEVMDAVADVADRDAEEKLDGLFERIEVESKLAREPSAWPLRNRRNREAQLEEQRARKAAMRVVMQETAAEVVVLRRNGTLLAHVDKDSKELLSEDEETATPVRDDEDGLVHVVRTVSRTISKQVREFDLGAFKRCSVQGDFGLIVIGRVGNVLAGARRTFGVEPLRLWERVTVNLEDASRALAP